jgi:hypothetical protein
MPRYRGTAFYLFQTASCECCERVGALSVARSSGLDMRHCPVFRLDSAAASGQNVLCSTKWPNPVSIRKCLARGPRPRGNRGQTGRYRAGNPALQSSGATVPILAIPAAQNRIVLAWIRWPSRGPDSPAPCLCWEDWSAGRGRRGRSGAGRTSNRGGTCSGVPV